MVTVKRRMLGKSGRGSIAMDIFAGGASVLMVDSAKFRDMSRATHSENSRYSRLVSNRLASYARSKAAIFPKSHE